VNLKYTKKGLSYLTLSPRSKQKFQAMKNTDVVGFVCNMLHLVVRFNFGDLHLWFCFSKSRLCKISSRETCQQ